MTIQSTGLILPDQRNKTQTKLTEQVHAALPKYALPSPQLASGDKIFLTRARQELDASKNEIGLIWQTTGSCVGAGEGNADNILQAVEIYLQNEQEDDADYWWPFTYGHGRKLAGFNRQGSGSFGAAQAKAAKQFGHLLLKDTNGLSYKIVQGWRKLTSQTELAWSTSTSRAFTSAINAAAKPFTTNEYTRVSSSEQTVAVLSSGYPCTIASGRGETRTLNYRGSGTDRMRVSRLSSRIAHQQSILGYVVHPSLGLHFFYMNQWGPNAHGKDPGYDTPDGGYFVSERDHEANLRDRNTECYAFSRREGVKKRDIDLNLW